MGWERLPGAHRGQRRAGEGDWAAFAEHVCHRRLGSVLTVSCSPRRRTMTSAGIGADPGHAPLQLRWHHGADERERRPLPRAEWARARRRARARSSSPPAWPPPGRVHRLRARHDGGQRRHGPVADRAPAGWPDVAAHEHRPWPTSASATAPRSSPSRTWPPSTSAPSASACPTSTWRSWSPDLNRRRSPCASTSGERDHRSVRNWRLRGRVGRGDLGLVEPAGGEITVHMDGGDASTSRRPRARSGDLIGPATFVGTVEVEL